MNKPLEPLKWQHPYEPSALQKVAKVIDNMLLAQEYRDKFRSAHNYRYPATKEQYELLISYHAHPVMMLDAIAQQFIDEKGNSL